ncbi:MAG TPA: DUF971 domain-containing protein [Thermoanaerobaculia bacterium]
MKPLFMNILGNELVVAWDDGHESYYPVDELRRACPCAACAGEPDLFGRVAKGPAREYSAASFHLVNVESIGNYGVQPNWADGHTWGIWTFDRLRAFCPCETCRKSG